MGRPLGHILRAFYQQSLTCQDFLSSGVESRSPQPIVPARITQDPGMFNLFKEKHWRLFEAKKP